MKYSWRGHASGEGGPILIADLDAFLFWGGSDPRWEEHSVYIVHSYGPVVRRLPPRFLPQGPEEWHQSARIPTLTAAQSYLRTLLDAVMALEPSAAIRDQLPMAPDELLRKARAAFESAGGPHADKREEWLRSWRDHLEQGIDVHLGEERIFHVDLKPDTDYARGCDAMTDDATRITFGPARQGVLWELEGGGVAEVAVDGDGEGFLLLRTWVNEERDEQTARAHVEGAVPEEEMAELPILSGVAAIVWSPVPPSDLVEGQDVGAFLRRAARSDSPVQLNSPGIQGIGTLVQVRPGDYRVSCGTHESENWSCRWARFTRREK